ncbi:hypothetical protein AMECASPLE_031137 [Ameca splendens]|uniref:Uncharacterized protein n=1 Tax=Ameca splendens TaxID=208324 RepID=A0ABV0Z5A5_9TELE
MFQTVEIWHSHWLQNLIVKSVCFQNVPIDDKSVFFPARKCSNVSPHHYTASTKRCLAFAEMFAKAYQGSTQLSSAAQLKQIWNHLQRNKTGFALVSDLLPRGIVTTKE